MRFHSPLDLPILPHRAWRRPTPRNSVASALIISVLLISVPFALRVDSVLAAQESPTTSSPVPHQTALGSQEGTEPSSVSGTRKPAATSELIAWREAFAPATWSNWALAIFAAVAALIALRTLRAIRRQAEIANESLSAERKATEAAKAQAELSQKTLVLTQRPKLIVRNIVVKTPGDPLRQTAPFQPGYSVEGEFQVVNVGGTPATITQSGCRVFWNQVALPMHRPYEHLSPNNPVRGVLQPGTSVVGGFMSDRPMDQHAAEIWQAGNQWSLYVMGWVEYRDDLGFVRRTVFCRRYDVGRGRRFFAVDDPDYEYAD
jgi:hypothetical protein